MHRPSSDLHWPSLRLCKFSRVAIPVSGFLNVYRREYFELDERNDLDAITGTMNGLFTVGGLFGALISSITADLIGRKRAVFAACVTSCAGGALQSGSVNIGMYIFMRFLTGVGVGMILVLIPLYQSDVSPPHSRGLMVGIHGICITLGYCLGGCKSS